MINLKFHLEINGSDASWRVDSVELPLLHACATRLTDCRRMAIHILEALKIDTSIVRLIIGDTGILLPV